MTAESSAESEFPADSFIRLHDIDREFKYVFLTICLSSDRGDVLLHLGNALPQAFAMSTAAGVIGAP